MSELIKSFIIVFTLSGATFWIVKKALPEFMASREFKRWRMLWLAFLISAYAAHSAWLLFAAIVFFCLVFTPSNPKYRIIYYLLLLSALPLVTAEIPGFGGVRFIFTLNYQRLLVLVLLTVFVVTRPAKPKLFALPSDIFVFLFVLFTSYSSFRDNTFTNALRECLMNVLDILIPYLAISRYLDSKEQLNKAFLALLIGMAPFAVIGCFETLKHWHIFNSMKHAVTGGRGNLYDIREGGLRASSVYGSPIVLGYVMVIGFGLLMYLQPLIKNQRYVQIAGLGIVGCILATMARGTWIGLAFFYVAYLWTGKGGMKKITLWGMAGVASLPLLNMTTLGQKFISLLPFIGESRSDTIDYRKRLIEQAWIVFKRHPWVGSTTFRETPEMESMRQGQGIIDLVNSYIGIVLPYGIVGLGIFLVLFLSLTARCYFLLKRIAATDEDLLRMGRVLFALLASILLMIGTVSSIDYIPVYYWTFAGVTAAYLQVCKQQVDLKAKAI